jgi:hypothetical protein
MTAGRETLWGSRAASGPEELLDSERELRVVACTSRHRWPRDPLGIAGRKRTGGAARLGAGATRRRMHISAPQAARPFWGQRAASGPEARLRMPISAPPAAGPARGQWAASGPEELRDSERSHGCRRDAVTVRFQYLVPQVTVSDDPTIYSDSALLDSELGVETPILPFELGTKSIKAEGRGNSSV